MCQALHEGNVCDAAVYTACGVQTVGSDCEKPTHWSKLSEWTRRERGQRSEALMSVLQDWESGGQAPLGSLALVIYLLVRESFPWVLIG